MFTKSTSVLLAVTLLLVACQPKNRFHIGSFEHPVEVKINRFDLDFIALDTTDVASGLIALENKYPAFFLPFLSDVLMMQVTDTVENASQIKTFLQDTTFHHVHQQVKTIFEDIKSVEEQFSMAFSYLRYYFADMELPKVYFFVSGFNQQFLLSDSILGIGSDLYLGADFPLYKDITYEYLLPSMRKEMLVPDALNTLLHQKFPFKCEVNLLNTMIYEGKIRYLLEVLMPDANAELIMGYSKAETGWCKQYEKTIWTSILEQKHLYSTDYMLINQYINPAPFTSPVSNESPGRLGTWVGYQIVAKYMQNNKDVSLPELMQNENYQALLEQSLYRP
ncbi:MAG: hypothetical protein PHQ11_04485 [Paludibacter sp.]|nr:hypothetical protein [Paludibacter sp.]MDD4198133.1 hypothetical protein [Paludibacter sp.]MDD4427371.1 hypothetical protein [Paludibacter sp.]